MAHSLPNLARTKSTQVKEPERKWKGWPHPPRFVPPPLPSCAEPGPKWELYQKQARRQRLRNKIEEVEKQDFHGFGGSIEGLRAFLAHKYGGGSVRGWRTAVAPDDLYRSQMGTASITFGEFCLAMKRIGYSGQVKTVYKELSKNNRGAFCALEDFEPDLAEQLDAFCKIYMEEYKNGAWEAWQDIRREHMGRATFDEFSNFLEEQELLPEEDIDLRRIFEVLDLAGLGTITVHDLHFLDHWVARRFDRPVPEEPKVEKEENPPWSPPPPKEPREMTASDFRNFLEKRFGSAARAWRMMLDIKGVGHLGPSDFGMGCRQAGWTHPYHPIWRELRKEGGGFVTMRALDPQTADAIDAFNEAVLAKYEDVYEFWSEVVDPNGTCTANITEFVADACADLGITADQARRIFKCLDTQDMDWLAVTEFGFLETFRKQKQQLLPSSSLYSDASDSTQIPRISKGFSTSTHMQHSTSLGALSSTTYPPAKEPVWRSTRGMQRSSFCQSKMVKTRWLTHAAVERLMHSTTGAPARVEKSPHRDIFRSTNEFYREGVKLLESQKKEESESSTPQATPVQKRR